MNEGSPVNNHLSPYPSSDIPRLPGRVPFSGGRAVGLLSGTVYIVQCSRCHSAPAREGRKTCEACAEYFRGRDRERTDKSRKRLRQRQSLRAWMDELRLSTPCIDCGKLVERPEDLHWDHLPSFVKHYNIGAMVSNKFSQGAIEIELTKCEPVCGECHRQRGKARAAAGVKVIVEILPGGLNLAHSRRSKKG